MNRFFNSLGLLLISSISAFSQSPVVDYKFSGNAADSSGNGLHGTVHGATLTTDRSDNANAAYYFDGIDDYIEVPHDALLNFDTQEDFTICLWVKQASQSTDRTYLIGKEDGGSSIPFPYSVFINANNTAFGLGRFDLCAGWPEMHSSEGLEIDEFHHITLVHTHDSLIVYKDNNLEQGEPSDNTVCTTVNNLNILIGTGGGSVNGFFHGVIDDIKIFNRRLNLDEIKEVSDINTNVVSHNDAYTEEQLSFFPNPADESITISSEHSGLLSLMDLEGNTVLSNVPISTSETIDVSNYSSGIYYLKIETWNEVISSKLIIE